MGGDGGALEAAHGAWTTGGNAGLRGDGAKGHGWSRGGCGRKRTSRRCRHRRGPGRSRWRDDGARAAVVAVTGGLAAGDTRRRSSLVGAARRPRRRSRPRWRRSRRHPPCRSWCVGGGLRVLGVGLGRRGRGLVPAPSSWWWRQRSAARWRAPWSAGPATWWVRAVSRAAAVVAGGAGARNDRLALRSSLRSLAWSATALGLHRARRPGGSWSHRSWRRPSWRWR